MMSSSPYGSLALGLSLQFRNETPLTIHSDGRVPFFPFQLNLARISARKGFVPSTTLVLFVTRPLRYRVILPLGHGVSLALESFNGSSRFATQWRCVLISK